MVFSAALWLICAPAGDRLQYCNLRPPPGLQVHDLLAELPRGANGAKQHQPPALHVRNNPTDGVYVENLTAYPADGPDTALAALQARLGCRTWPAGLPGTPHACFSGCGFAPETSYSRRRCCTGHREH